MEGATFNRVKLLSSTKNIDDVRCLAQFNLEEWASFKNLIGRYETLCADHDWLNRRRSGPGAIYLLAPGDRFPNATPDSPEPLN